MAKEWWLKGKEGWENDSEVLRSPPLRRVASAPWGPSTAAEQSSAQQKRERGRENRHLLLLVPTARLEPKPGTGVWIVVFAKRLPKQMESYEENERQAEQRRGAEERKTERALFHGTNKYYPNISVTFIFLLSLHHSPASTVSLWTMQWHHIKCSFHKDFAIVTPSFFVSSSSFWFQGIHIFRIKECTLNHCVLLGTWIMNMNIERILSNSVTHFAIYQSLLWSNRAA